MTFNDFEGHFSCLTLYVNPVSWKCIIWLLLRVIISVYWIEIWKSSYHKNNEGLLKVTTGHVCCTSANISERAGDSDIVTTDN